jgi:hypothetical protein
MLPRGWVAISGDALPLYDRRRTLIAFQSIAQRLELAPTTISHANLVSGRSDDLSSAATAQNERDKVFSWVVALLSSEGIKALFA